jgi:hypothetical protein
METVEKNQRGKDAFKTRFLTISAIFSVEVAVGSTVSSAKKCERTILVPAAAQAASSLSVRLKLKEVSTRPHWYRFLVQFGVSCPARQQP